ncbi:MAG: hypothetical protein M3R68_06465 [Acidobacteriota bacterium]|nr:hypothetical protein [Acidobacteriota bacterium]
MNCEKFLALANDLTRDHGSAPDQRDFAGLVPMEANERESALAHVTECESCAARWEDEHRLTSNLRSLARGMESVSAPAQLEEKLLAVFSERGNVILVVRPFPLPQQQSLYWLAAIAAALLIAFGIIVVRTHLFNGSKPQLAVTRPEQPEESPIVPVTVGEKPSVPGAKKVEMAAPIHAPRRNPRSSLAVLRPAVRHVNEPAEAVADAKALENNDANKEVATGFFPIGYGTAPNLQDGGQLLRVELPRSAVARLGLPVNMDRAGERVKADVLVGADGLAQAIRFIH